uniref:RNA-directed DNA polymerase, eukaryota, reverse transcriptase zinc-binding domain protein n=1 Tax=Tanacetum cinerariifolium TaxID=118510 RepID=A0A6L2M4G5_TANCI|nr:RNA-directed DNA polymerase, eukaryota, reverse transcriptase zinc-binding domain protein [Tanacetum cinerariifolium]
MDFKIGCWNIRGLGTTDKQNEIKKFIEDEKLGICAIIETRLKAKKLQKIRDNVFKKWNWVNNMKYCDKGCGILVGWNNELVNVNVIHYCKQAVLCKINVIRGNLSIFLTIVYTANGGYERMKLWKELIMSKRVVGNEAWALMWDINVTLDLREHSARRSSMTKDMSEFKDRVNIIEVEDIASTGLFYILTKNLCKTKHGMVKDVSDPEIKKAMFQINDKKAHGPGGFSSHFYKKAWNTVGEDECKAVSEFFTNGKLEINSTIISLVPKIQTPAKVSDYRPITCCNVIYKCISRFLTERIKKGVGKLVSQNQSAFIPHKQIQDNNLISQDLLRGYDRKGGPKRVALKIDLQKAYDTVNWSFLEKILKGFGFHDRMVHWVMTCVTATKFFICVNEKSCGYFKCVMEITIEEFSSVSGLLPNYNKRNILFGSVKEEDRQSILSVIPFRVEKLPVKYLGVPLISKRIRVKYCKSLVDNVRNKVLGWKNKYLSYAGRLQLDKKANGRALVACKNLCKPKSHGGLGLKNLSSWNKALIIKHLWHIAMDKNTMWIGNGSKISIFDYWNESGILNEHVTYRDVYDARFNTSITVKEFVEDKGEQWPDE